MEAAVAYENPVPEHKRPTPARCGVLADKLSEAIRAIRSANVRVSDLSRLSRSVIELKSVARDGVFPPGPTQRRRLAHALRDAYDFEQIAILLPPSRYVALAADLALALKGTLDQTEGQRRPYQFQSRLWMQAVFQGSGLSTTALPSDTAGPDFTITLPSGTVYGIEVKRPEHSGSLVSNVAEAVKQLADAAMRGGIAIDVSECLHAESAFRLDAPVDEAPYASIDSHFERIYRQVGSNLFDSSTKQVAPGRAHVFFVIVYARAWCWRISGDVPPELYTRSQFGVFVSTKGNLLYHHALALQRSWEAGLLATGLHISRITSGDA